MLKDTVDIFTLKLAARARFFVVGDTIGPIVVKWVFDWLRIKSKMMGSQDQFGYDFRH